MSKLRAKLAESYTSIEESSFKGDINKAIDRQLQKIDNGIGLSEEQSEKSLDFINNYVQTKTGVNIEDFVDILIEALKEWEKRAQSTENE